MNTTITLNRIFKTFSRLQRSSFSALFLLIFLLSSISSWGQITQRGTATTATIASTNMTDFTINKPSGVVAGDVMIASFVQNETDNDNGGMIDVSLSGWTLIDGRTILQEGTSNGSNLWRGSVLYKVADGTEGANFTFSTSIRADMIIGSIVAFSGVDVTGGVKADGTSGGPFDLDPGTLNVTSSDSSTSTAIGVSTLSANAAVLMLSLVNNDRTFSGWAATNPASLTELYDNFTTNEDDAALGAAWAIRSTAGTTGNGTVTLSGSNRSGAMFLVLKRCTSPMSVASASSTPTLCINTALTNITHTTTGATGIGTATGLPSGVTAAWASNTITISGTPTASGTFSYSIPLTGGCGSGVSATGTITVTAANTAGTASSNPTLCINTALTNITRTTTGATGIGTATGLPAGVTAAWASNTITISGTPTAAGTFSYSIPLTGGCGSVNATGTITVTAANTAGTASSTPTLCINTALTNITHATTGATGIGTATGLPAGVTAAWASNTLTISGTPTASGTFSYSIPLTGGCGSVNATGTITVTAANTAGTASSTPTLCNNTALTAITHATTGATVIGTATGLPAGVTAAFAFNTITISGTPTAAGIFNYSIPLTGGCGSVNATGTITVTAANTAGTASSTPTLCINTALTNITHATTGATGIGTATGLPAGVTAAFASNTITISGTPIAAGTFNYSIPLTGGCGSVNATGTITINEAPSTTGISICAGGSDSLSATFSSCPILTGQTIGPRGATSGTNVTGVGDVAWSNPQNIAVSGSNATRSLSGSQISNYLLGSNFGFNIPLDAIIDGITVTITRLGSSTSSGGIRDSEVKLFVDNTIQSTNKAVTGTNWSTSSTNAIYGGSNDLWGSTTLTPSLINQPDFGVVLSVRNANTNNSRTATVSQMQITVTYTLPGSLNWYTVSSGGTAIGSGSTFNPVGVAGSGLANTNTPGTTPYWVECTTAVGSCRSQADFVINPSPTVNAGTAFTKTCVANTSGAAIGETAEAGHTYSWSPSTGLSSATASNPTANPTTTTTYTVTKTNTASGCTATGTVIVTVNNSAISVNAGTAFTKTCVANTSGAAIGETAEAGHTYSWSPSTGLSSATASNPTANPTTTTTYTVTKTNTASGCTATGTVIVTVDNQAPTVTVSANQSICAGSSVTLSGSGATSYSWNNGISNGVAFTPSATTTYTVTGTDDNGCSNTASTTITVNPIVTPTFTQVAAICSGDTLAALPTTSNNGITGTWSPALDNTATTTYTFTPTAGQCASVATMTITVNPVINPSVSIAASATTICSGTSVTFTATPTNGGASPSYQWKVNGNNVGTNSATYTSTTLANTDEVKVILTVNTTQCLPGSETSSNTVTMTVNPNLPASVSIAASPSAFICIGTSATFTATPTNGGATPSYQWKLNGNNVGTNSATYSSSTIANNDVVSVVMTSTATCVTGSPVTSNVITMTVSPLPCWTGSNNTSWNLPQNWAEGVVPTDQTAVFISGTAPNQPQVQNGTAYANSIQLLNNAVLTIKQNAALVVTNGITVPSTAQFIVENNANFVQINPNAVNSGSIKVKRNTRELQRLDYVLWSSPIEGTQTLKQFSPQTVDNRFYTYNSATNLYDVMGNVQVPFQKGKGYLIRTPNNHPTTPTVWSAEFNGVPNNGTITQQLPAPRAGNQNRYFLVGNPYASEINIMSFMQANEANINGIIYIWRKTNGTAISAYGSIKRNPNNSIQFTSNGNAVNPGNFIPSGQGFIVDMKEGASQVVFTNDMRVFDQFGVFNRTSQVTNNTSDQFTLKLGRDNGEFTFADVGYFSNASNNYEPSYDVQSMSDASLSVASIVENKRIVSQSRAAFDTSHVVPLSIITNVAGNYKLSLDSIYGVFADNQIVYLRDNLMNTIHNLTEGSYSFASQIGTFDSRFEIIYQLPLAVSTPVVTSIVGSYTYNGSPQGPNAATNTGIGTSYTFIYEGTGSTIYAASSIAPTNAGTYTVTATVEATGNYASASSSATAFTIEAATPVVTSTIGSYTYNGSSQGPNAATNTGTGTSYTFIYEGTGSTIYAASSIAPTNAGTYTVTATVEATGNYASASSSATAFTIEAATPVVTSTVGSYTYNGSSQGPNAATNTGIGTSYTFIYEGTGSTIYAASSIAPTNAGTYTVTATVEATGNYASASSSATVFTIEAATPVVTSTVGSYTYNGSSQGPNAATNTGIGTSYTFIYEGTGSTIYAASSIAPTNAGTYTVTATVEATSNYASASSSATAFTIEAATPVVTSTVGSYTYNGSSQGPNSATNTGTGTSYTFIYEGTGSTIYAASSIAPTNAGTYTVTATVEATGNYASASSSATAFAITAKPLTITALDYSKCVGVNYVLPSNGYSIEGLVGSQSIDNVTLSSTGNPSNSVVGTYPIVAQNATGGTFNNSNYSITYIDGTLTVDPLSVGGTASASSTSVVSGNSTTITLTDYTGAIQWQSSNDGDSWTDEVGATQNTYTTPVLTQTVHYRALVTSGACFSVLSSSVVIAVDSAPLAVPTFNESQVVIYKTPTNEISINTGNVVMSMVKIFDIRGRLLQEQKDINASQTFMNAVLTTEVLLVQITSEEGVVVTKKVLFPRTSLKLDKNLKAKTQLAEDE